jgi:hypothetical protein
VADVEPGSLSPAALLARTEAILGVDWELQQEIFRDMLKKENKYRVFNPEVSCGIAAQAHDAHAHFAMDLI